MTTPDWWERTSLLMGPDKMERFRRAHVLLFGSGEALKVAAVMITMALAGKWIASWVTQDDFQQKHNAEPTSVHLLTEHARDESQYQQGQRIGHNSSPHRNTHAAVTRHPVSNHDRIGYQGVRGIHTGHGLFKC